MPAQRKHQSASADVASSFSSAAGTIVDGASMMCPSQVALVIVGLGLIFGCVCSILQLTFARRFGKQRYLRPTLRRFGFPALCSTLTAVVGRQHP